MTFKDIIHLRSALTAGHCVCGDKKGHDKVKKCLRHPITNEPKNQITQINHVRVHMGSNLKRRRFWYRQKYVEKYVNEAWILYDETNTALQGTFDLAVLKSDVNLFNDDNKYIGAICLAALDADITKEEITTVGWGDRYSEYPERDLTLINYDKYDKYNPDKKRKPTNQYGQIKSSCSTNQYGPKDHRFKPCDMHFLERNNWGCLKTKRGAENWNIEPREPNKNPEFPKGYDVSKCKRYFDSANKLFDIHYAKKGKNALRAIEQEFRLVKYMTIQTQKSGEIQCYKEDLFIENGWCKIKSKQKMAFGLKKWDEWHNEWGFCDSSCELASVNNN